MAKTKLKAQIKVPDGRGGMVVVKDRRFERTGKWPISLEVSAEQADTWLEYFYAECDGHSWSASGVSQLEAKENNGTINVNPGSEDKPELSIVWERRRGGELRIRARSDGARPLSHAEAQELFDQVTARCRSRVQVQFHRCWHLEFEGLPWQGEFWLDDTLRLGPPSRQYTSAAYGPRAVMVDAIVSCIRKSTASETFQKQLQELSIFLSIVMGTAVHVTENGRRAWTWKTGAADCDVRNVAYWDQQYSTEMPVRGVYASVPFRQVSRPDFAERGLEDQTFGQVFLPSDINDLWGSYRRLTADRRRQFLQAGAKWQEAYVHWRDRDTLSVALAVVGGETLKPSDPEHRNSNIYDVVRALLGDSVAKRLDVGWFRAQGVRNVHLHAGEFLGSELIHATMNASFEDPTFDEARRALMSVAREAIIEWLRRGGVYPIAPRRQHRRWFRRVRQHPFTLVAVGITAFILGLLVAMRLS